jgi:hypothetical protein
VITVTLYHDVHVTVSSPQSGHRVVHVPWQSRDDHDFGTRRPVTITTPLWGIAAGRGVVGGASPFGESPFASP